jgi:CubicO group peptidase (beta-lactamase class C family)
MSSPCSNAIRILLLSVISSLLPGSLCPQSDPLDGLDAYIQESMTDWQVPGLAIAIVKDDSVVFIRGYGVREVRKDAPVDAHTVFAIGSTTKAFTAAAVAMLVDEGTVSWEDPVVKHLPWFQLPDPWVTRQVTVRDLLAHRVAGDVGRSTGRLYYWPTSLNSEEVLRRLHFLEIGSPRFRSGFVYCNECYMAAGEIVAAVSQMSWEEFVKARIFGPLQMSSAAASAYELWDAENVRPCWVCVLGTRTVGIEDARAENIVMPHVSSDGEPRPIEWMAGGAGGPAGGLSASAADLAKWMRLLLAKGVYQEERLLSETVVNDMFSAQVIRHPPAWYFPMQYRAGDVAGHFWAYGFGWLLTDYRGEKLVMHGGGVPGQASFITLMPGQHLGIAVLTNKDAALAWALPFRVLDAYLAAPEASRTNPMKSVIV